MGIWLTLWGAFLNSLGEDVDEWRREVRLFTAELWSLMDLAPPKRGVLKLGALSPTHGVDGGMQLKKTLEIPISRSTSTRIYLCFWRCEDVKKMLFCQRRDLAALARVAPPNEVPAWSVLVAGARWFQSEISKTWKIESQKIHFKSLLYHANGYQVLWPFDPRFLIRDGSFGQVACRALLQRCLSSASHDAVALASLVAVANSAGAVTRCQCWSNCE